MKILTYAFLSFCVAFLLIFGSHIRGSLLMLPIFSLKKTNGDLINSRGDTSIGLLDMALEEEKLSPNFYEVKRAEKDFFGVGMGYFFSGPFLCLDRVDPSGKHHIDYRFFLRAEGPVLTQGKRVFVFR